MQEPIRINTNGYRGKYIYRCEECGCEVVRSTRCDNYRKLCFECSRFDKKMRAIKRNERKEKEIRDIAINDLRNALSCYCEKRKVDCSENSCPFCSSDGCKVILIAENLKGSGK